MTLPPNWFVGLVALTTGLFALSSCTYVKVSDAGAAVTQASQTDVASCEQLGEVVTHTRHKVLLDRPSGKVKQELIDLARNQAASMGANAIVAQGEPVNGAQTFTAYKCN